MYKYKRIYYCIIILNVEAQKKFKINALKKCKNIISKQLLNSSSERYNFNTTSNISKYLSFIIYLKQNYLDKMYCERIL